MRKNKGLYLLIAFISVILIFFCILFFMHERTLENGILFKVSFEYDNAKNVIYNFYNQNGKIGKVETWENYETSYLLDKTDYHSVKLLRRLLKGRKESKEPSKEEGITIYNGQNKRYYFLPFDSEGAEELSKLIIDGYIHSEMKRITGKTFYHELYLYEKEDGLNWTKDGSTSRIIHTYQCEVEDCKYLYVGAEQETVLLDRVNYYYNYVTKTKEEIYTSETIKQTEFVSWDNRILGINLQNEENKWAYYDLEKKECLTEFENQKIKIINSELLLLEKRKQVDSQISYELQVWNRNKNEAEWTKEQIDNSNIEYEIEKKDEFYLLKRNDKKEITYQIRNDQGNIIIPKFVEEIEWDEDKNIVVKTKENNETIYELYNKEGNLLKKNKSKEELLKKED